LWVYYSGQILFFGAELTEAYANRFGVHLEPKPHAEWVRDARCARPDAKAGGPNRRPEAKDPPRDRRSELVEELKEQVHSIRRSTGH
jgi:membrane protein